MKKVLIGLLIASLIVPLLFAGGEEDIGEYLGIKRDTVYKWIAEKNMLAH